MKLCIKCGGVKVKDRCLKCYPLPQHKQTTKQRGYGNDHRTASERYRTEHSLCEACVMETGVIGAKNSTSMHHIVKIIDAPQLRMQRSNWLALCEEHHDQLENDILRARAIKIWSEANYEQAMK